MSRSTTRTTQEAQATALIMSARNGMDHRSTIFRPRTGSAGRSWAMTAQHCRTWHVGNTGPPAIDQLVRDSGKLIRDGGKDTGVVGHRRTILNPQNISMGSGSVPATDQGSAAEAQLMVSNPSDVQRPARDGFVAWPPPGFVPYQTVYPRWSFVLRGADFTNAAVTMQRNGVPLGTDIINGTASPGPESSGWPTA